MTEREIKRRFRLALVGYLILTAACVAGIAYNYGQQQDLREHQRVIVAQLAQIRRNQAAIVRLTANTAAAICLEAFATTPAQRERLVHQFNVAGRISVAGNPTCQRAVAQALRLVAH